MNTDTLLIEKNGTNKFYHTHNGVTATKFILSDFEISLDGNKFKVVELNGSSRYVYLVTNITIQDNTGLGLPETFVDPQLFYNRLVQLNYTPILVLSGFTLTTDQYDALNAASPAPSLSNPYATVANLAGGVAIRIIPFGEYIIFKAEGNGGTALLAGDEIQGRWSGTAWIDDGTFGMDIPRGMNIRAEYVAGDINLISSYTNIGII